MFLTSFRFNPVRRGAQRLLNNPHALHAAVLAGFPDPSATESGRVLWRLDQRQHEIKLYIVSPRQPDFTHLAEQAGWPTLDDSWAVRSYQPLLDRIETGDRYAFRLTANPVRNVRLQPGERGKPYGQVTAAQQEQWLLDRQTRAGFQIPSLTEDSYAVKVIDRRLLNFRRGETQVSLRVATYEGELNVVDRDVFVSTLTSGIGRAKGYGCGLLTIATVR